MFAFLNKILLKVRLSFLSGYYEKYNNYLEIVCFDFDFWWSNLQLFEKILIKLAGSQA